MAAKIWYTKFFRLYEFEIIDLLQKRDIVINKWQVEHQGINIYEDRNLVITSCTSVSVEHKIKAVNKTISVSAGLLDVPVILNSKLLAFKFWLSFV